MTSAGDVKRIHSGNSLCREAPTAAAHTTMEAQLHATGHEGSHPHVFEDQGIHWEPLTQRQSTLHLPCPSTPAPAEAPSAAANITMEAQLQATGYEGSQPQVFEDQEIYMEPPAQRGRSPSQRPLFRKVADAWSAIVPQIFFNFYNIERLR